MSGVLISIVVILILLFCSALISGSEIAFYSLSPAQKNQLKLEDSKNALLAKKLLEKPHDLLATILIVNNFINVGIVILSSAVLQTFKVSFQLSETTYMILEVFLITFIILLIGEVIPKVYATKNGIALAKFMARPLYFFSKLPPFSWLKSFLTNGTNIINKYAKKRVVKISSDELEQALALTKEDDTSHEEQRILEGIIKFGNTEVKQIMRSRMEVEAFEEASSFREILAFILDAGYSRIPIYEKTFDNVIGILYIKDLLPYFDEKDDFEWKNLIRKPFFVPENKKIDDLLKEFQSKKMHMAVVIDEYGGANGIVTLEDVLEEIIGDITDEFDEDDIVFQQENENEYIFEGRTSLIDFYKVLDIDGKEFEAIKGDSDSIAGLLIENAGKILRNKEFIRVGIYKLIVESSDKRRIKSIKVIRDEKI
ncbi:MAG: gliding motility-associated protein GldE [Flavobacteriia bacterium]|jgi:putative hemolysin